MINSVIIAFAMYSKIPMPRVDWNEKNMKYVMAAFPLVGLIIGLLEVGVYALLEYFAFGGNFRTVVLVTIPVLVTGGIHMDGFMDTMDARSSWGDMEKKLAILKDSHTGAFAILGCVMYFLVSFGVWSELSQSARGIRMAVFAFFFSRCLSGLGVTLFRCAKNSGLAHTFHSAAHKTAVRNVLTVELILCVAAMVVTDWQMALPALIAGTGMFGYYRHFSYKEFGGINGDMAGYFLALCELLMAMAVAVAGRICCG